MPLVSERLPLPRKTATSDTGEPNKTKGAAGGCFTYVLLNLFCVERLFCNCFPSCRKEPLERCFILSARHDDGTGKIARRTS